MREGQPAPAKLCFALHAATQSLVRCGMMLTHDYGCDRIATRVAPDGTFCCDVCATFLPAKQRGELTPLPYAAATRTADLIMARGALDELSLEEALPEIVGASTGLLAALPSCPPFGGKCQRCRFSSEPYIFYLLDSALRSVTGSASAPALA